MASTKFLAIVFMFFQGIVHQSGAAVTFTSSATGSIAENTAAETQIIQLVATGDISPYTYAITGVTHANLASWFEIVDTDKLRIATGATVDFENSDLSASTVTIALSATDSTPVTPVVGTQNFVLTITNVDEQPAFTASSLVSKLATAPATTTLLTLAAVDPEGDALTYALSATNDAHVQIAGAVISVKAGVTLADCVKIMAVTVKDPANDAVADYAVACIGSCMASCDSSSAGAITGNTLGIMTALGVLMILYEYFH